MRRPQLIFLIPISIITIILFSSYMESSFDKNSKNNDSAEMMSSEELPDEENFNKIMEVLMHKRCVNCHPSGDAPRQGEDSHMHNFGIVRGENDHGMVAYTCNTCHTHENNDFSGVPGAPHWAAAPRGMAWEGKTRVEIAEQMMDPQRNGGRSHQDILHHLTEDQLVLWAWDPGVDAEGVNRETPPVPKEEFIIAVKQWIENGAVIPAK